MMFWFGFTLGLLAAVGCGVVVFVLLAASLMRRRQPAPAWRSSVGTSPPRETKGQP